MRGGSELATTEKPLADQADMSWSQAEFLTKRLSTEISRDEYAAILLSSWRQWLGLFDWDIRYDSEPAESGHAADICWRDQENIAILRLDPVLPVEAMESAVLHELLHLVLKPYSIPVERLLALTSGRLQHFARNEIEDAEEHVIEQIVRAFGFPRFQPYGEALLKDWKPFSG